MNKWIAEFELEDGDTMPEHMDLNYMGAKIDFHCRPMWIPVSERLPEEFESVLVCYKSQGGMAQAVSERFGTHTGYKWSALAGIEPIAWMPLPAPFEPQESEDGEP